MPTINVVKAFTLQLDPPVIGEEPDPADKEGKKMRPVYGPSDKIRYTPGTYDVSDDVAAHWYTQAHLAGYEEPPPAMGTAQFAQAALLAAQGVRMAQPVHTQGQIPAPLPDDVRVATRSGEVPADAHYFAGQKQEDKPLPNNAVRPPGEPQTPGSDASLLGKPATAQRPATKR